MYKYKWGNYILILNQFYRKLLYWEYFEIISKDYDEDGDQDIFTLFFYSDPGCNSFSQLNYDAIAQWLFGK